MPTRIVLSKKSVPRQTTPRASPVPPPRRDSTVNNNNHRDTGGIPASHSNISRTSSADTPKRTNTTSAAAQIHAPIVPVSALTPITPAARLPTFRSSILRDLDVRRSDDDDASLELERKNQTSSHMTGGGDDLRGSPRLLGYLFSTVAAAVMLVSVVEFYRDRGKPPDDLPLDSLEKYVYSKGGNPVFRWKLFGAIYMSSAGVVLGLLTVAVHFDTVIARRLWTSFFRNGSLSERNWIFFLIVFWTAALHVSTSTLSVGESQPNVFFTTWIAFCASAMNYGVWREGAGFPPLTVRALVEGARETTQNWIWIGFFSFLFAGAATDIYYNRDEMVLKFRGQPLDLVTKDWVIVLSVVWGEVALCALAVVLNESFATSARLPCVVTRPTGRYRCVFGWRQLEGFVILTTTGAKFWVILEYAGVDGVITGLSNGYFGVWGSFFNSVFALGTWLRENKNIEYIVREPARSESTERQRPKKKDARKS